MNVIHAFTVSGVLNVSRTMADSLVARGVRSGIWSEPLRMDFEERRVLHQGMELKCAMGSGVGWPWLLGEGGLDVIFLSSVFLFGVVVWVVVFGYQW